MAPRRNFWVGLALGALLAVATALFIVQNGSSTGFRWLVWEFTAPLWLFLLASAASGAVLTLLAMPLARHASARAAERREAAKRLR